ncbi:hypothetical protein BLOT_004349 [Blomia tropicalis]|nr:hypothetical protein BLOT_004349 [Blomia tropicalis]
MLLDVHCDMAPVGNEYEVAVMKQLQNKVKQWIANSGDELQTLHKTNRNNTDAVSQSYLDASQYGP